MSKVDELMPEMYYTSFEKCCIFYGLSNIYPCNCIVYQRFELWAILPDVLLHVFRKNGVIIRMWLV